MKSRRDFLEKLFDLFERNSVPYCVLRNYEDIYTDPNSDVDLCAEASELARVSHCLAEAALATGYRLLQQTRYANLSFVYWNQPDDFLRVDIETETRWRSFPSASAPTGTRSCRR